MRLAEFIEQNARKITDEAAAFAETQAPPGVQLSAAALRDHIPGILAAIVLDLRTPQEPTQQRAKSEGRAPQCTGPESAASGHGRLRAKDGFDVNRMIAEYRALRATVLRLWIADEALTKDSIDDLIRFNEAIDQAAAESLADFTKEVESWRKMLLGVLGHDLRGPLSAIVGTSEVLSRMAMGTSYSVLAERLTEGAMRMSKLLNDLLAYNRTQLGIGIALNRSVCDLTEVLGDEIDLLRAALSTAVISFHAEGPTWGPFDASRIQEVLHNLVTNAFKYGHPDTEISVSLIGEDESVQLKVCNTGAPLPPDWANSIFEPLQRGPWTAAKGEAASLGLGLFIVREIVKAHGGEVTASSANGVTTFTVWLPRKA